jgi:hypothetical protein
MNYKLDGENILYCSENNVIEIIDLKKRQITFKKNFIYNINEVKWSPSNYIYTINEKGFFEFYIKKKKRIN